MILEGKGGELGRAEISVPQDGDDAEEAFSIAAHEQIELWILSPGDTIKIEEVR